MDTFTLENFIDFCDDMEIVQEKLIANKETRKGMKEIRSAIRKMDKTLKSLEKRVKKAKSSNDYNYIIRDATSLQDEANKLKGWIDNVKDPDHDVNIMTGYIPNKYVRNAEGDYTIYSDSKSRTADDNFHARAHEALNKFIYRTKIIIDDCKTKVNAVSQEAFQPSDRVRLDPSKLKKIVSETQSNYERDCDMKPDPGSKVTLREFPGKNGYSIQITMLDKEGVSTPIGIDIDTNYNILRDYWV